MAIYKGRTPVAGAGSTPSIDPTTKNKIRLPGDGQNGNVGKAHAVHCFFYYNV